MLFTWINFIKEKERRTVHADAKTTTVHYCITRVNMCQHAFSFRRRKISTTGLNKQARLYSTSCLIIILLRRKLQAHGDHYSSVSFDRIDWLNRLDITSHKVEIERPIKFVKQKSSYILMGWKWVKLFPVVNRIDLHQIQINKSLGT